MRIFATKDSVNFGEGALGIEGFKIMRHTQKIDLGREFIGGVSPIRICENGELSAINDALDFLLHIGEIAGGWQMHTNPEYSEWVRKFTGQEKAAKAAEG